MSEPIVMPPMDDAQAASWHAMMELHAKVPANWALVGGQLVHLHCAERGAYPTRPTTDADTVINIRADPLMLVRFTTALADLGFTADTSAEGHQHRWRRDLAQIDVLIPEGVGERAASRTGVGGAPTVSSPGTTQALARTEAVIVAVEGRVGTILRPNLIGALVGKAAARVDLGGGSAASRHCVDFVVLASLVAARDFRITSLGRKDRHRLRKMVPLCRGDSAAMLVDHADEHLARILRAVDL
ncbi:hypothetical protein FB381_0426 [Nocardioides albertanoniae]|uniref:Uncharacterized protein n=1 Tax=Nocardioides albertanoniae TaxID=1175486 RepID=A0A543A1W0_9ACTN|nr:hypothetical protein [Nocardioides albertanoniae]TQL66563.1 hypothetical protein FB381_0426 [Nocardioides albertanoniae]